MNDQCNWDDGDCWDRCSDSEAGAADFCYASQVGDGNCDRECMTSACGYDHGDCACNRIIDERYGFRSIGGVQSYSDDTHTCWLIQPQPPKSSSDRIRSITLTFQRFDTEEFYDVVQVFDGPHAVSENLLNRVDAAADEYGFYRSYTGQLQGYTGQLDVTTLPPLVATQHPALLIRFRSDSSVTSNGFLFGWTSTLTTDADWPRRGQCALDCKDWMRGDGHCDSSCMNAACDWDRRPAASVGDCELECYPGCKQEQLGNGLCEPGCGTAECGFDAIDCSCGNVLTECAGTITDGSDRYVDYDAAAHQCFLIQPSHNCSRVTLHWDRFDTGDGDFVRVYDGSSTLDRPLHFGHGYAGTSLPPSVSSTGGTLLVTFAASSFSSGGNGFRFFWNCSGSLSLYSSRIATVGEQQRSTTPNLLLNPAMISARHGYGSHGEAVDGWHIMSVTSAGFASPWGANLGASAEYTVLESVTLLGTCCEVTSRSRSGQVVSMERSGAFREQEIDLLALGFSSSYLDRAPAIYASERFAQMSMAFSTRSHYSLRIELRDAMHRVVAFWQPFSPAVASSHMRPFSPLQCTSACELTRQDGSPVWNSVRHAFTDYGPGVRYVHWRDGGIDGDYADGRHGTLLDDPELTIALDPRHGCALQCAPYGWCSRGTCVCHQGWQGPRCMTPASLTCPFNCSGRGTCSLIDGAKQHCHCFEESVGSYCSRRSTELPSHLSCNDGSALRRGFEVKLAPQSMLNANGKPHRHLSAREPDLPTDPSDPEPEHIPVVMDGVVLPDWTSSSKALPGNGTQMLSFDLSIRTPIPAAIGVPLVHVDEPNILSYRLHQAHNREIRLWQNDPPHRLQLTCECIQPGRSKMVVSIPVPGFCTIVFSWVKICTAEEILIEAKRRRTLLTRIAIVSIGLLVVAVFAVIKARKRCYKMCCQGSNDCVEYGASDASGDCCLNLRRRATGSLAAFDGMVPLAEEDEDEDKTRGYDETTMRFSFTYEIYSFLSSMRRMQVDVQGEGSGSAQHSEPSWMSNGSSSTQDTRSMVGQNDDRVRAANSAQHAAAPERVAATEDDLL